MDQSRLESLERHLTSTLLGWGIGSTALGSVLWLAGARSGRAAVMRFGRQTALWGATDAVIALVGIRSRHRRGELTEDEVNAQARTLQITLIANGLADVAYVAGGARVWARTGSVGSSIQGSRDASVARTYWGMGRGDGAAIMIQGAFLLVLDAVFALRVTRARN